MTAALLREVYSQTQVSAFPLRHLPPGLARRRRIALAHHWRRHPPSLNAMLGAMIGRRLNRRAFPLDTPLRCIPHAVGLPPMRWSVITGWRTTVGAGTLPAPPIEPPIA